MQYSYSFFICKVNCKYGETKDVRRAINKAVIAAPAFVCHRGMVLSRDPEVLILPFAFALLSYPRQWRVVICFVLPQANAGCDFPRPVAVRRVVKEVGFFIGVVVQVE